jgi:hypothetical protein
MRGELVHVGADSTHPHLGVVMPHVAVIEHGLQL